MKTLTAIFCLLTVSSSAFAKDIISCDQKFSSLTVRVDGEVYIERSGGARGPLYYNTDGTLAIRGTESTQETVFFVNATTEIKGNEILITLEDKSASAKIALVSPANNADVKIVKITATKPELKKAILGGLNVTDESELSFSADDCVFNK